MLVVWGLAACGPDFPEGTPSTSFEEMVAELRAQAVASGATDNQVAAIDAAAEAGEMDIAHLTAAFEGLRACIDDAGLQLVSPEVVKRNGRAQWEFGVRIDDSIVGGREAGELLLQDCFVREYDFASQLYDLQPASVEAYDRALAESIPEIAACLATRDVEVDASLDPPEFRADLLALVAGATDNSAAAGGQVSLAVVECLSNAGFTTLP